MRLSLKIVIVYSAFLFLIAALCSCGTVNKLFNKNKSKIDSTSIVHEKTDSVKSFDTTHLAKSDNSQTTKIEIDFADTIIKVDSANVIVSPKVPQDYFTYNIKTGEITTNKQIKSVFIEDHSQIKNIDSSSKHEATSYDKTKDDTTHLIKQTKVVTKSVKKTRLPIVPLILTLLFIVIIFIIYKNRNNIKSLALKIFTGI